MIEEKIDKLKGEIISFASHVQHMIYKSIKGLIEKDKNLLNEVINSDEPIANQKEILIDEMCTTIIAQFSPMASDMRMVLMILKMNNDMERIADHAVNIAQSSLFLIERPDLRALMDIPSMEQEVITMLNDSLTAFIDQNYELATEVCSRDDVVDKMLYKIISKLSHMMIENPDIVERAIKMMNIGYNLERIADLSTNISEEVVYLTKGKIIKHHVHET